MYDRAQAKKDLMKQTKTNYSKKDSGGFTSILKDDIPTWKCGEGKHKFDIIPFVVGKNHPTTDPGKAAYVFEIWVHYGVGPNNDSYLCLNKMYGEDCPVCNHRKELIDAGESDEAVIKQMKPKRNTLYNIICYDTAEEERKGVQVWNVSHFFMEQKLLAISEDASGEIITFADPDDGKRILFQRKGSGMGNTSYIGHQFSDRGYEISDKILAAAFKLDECVKKPDFDEVQKAVYGPPKQKEETHSKSKKDEDDVPNKIDIDEDAIFEMSRKELKEFISESKLDIDVDDFEEKKDLAAAVVKILFNKESLEEEDSENKTCPNKKGEFGKSFDEFRECVDCKLFDECSDEFDNKFKKSKTSLKRR